MNSIGYHNIEGKHSSLLGCKLYGHINLINDIEIPAETWSECKICKNINIENYKLLKVIEPVKKECRKGRKSGGIHIYCKTYLKPFPENNQNIYLLYIWFEINKNLFYNINKNLRACAFYSPPSNSTYFSEEIWDALEIDLLSLTTNETPFFIMGDMNGRVRELSEFIKSDINASNHITRPISGEIVNKQIK